MTNHFSKSFGMNQVKSAKSPDPNNFKNNSKSNGLRSALAFKDLQYYVQVQVQTLKTIFWLTCEHCIIVGANI